MRILSEPYQSGEDYPYTRNGVHYSDDGAVQSISVEASRTPFLGPDEAAAPIDVGGFQASNDAKVLSGNYDRFSEIGNALVAGQWGQAWRHTTFEASPEVRAVITDRLFPSPSPGAALLGKMTASPVGAGLYGIAHMLGADSQSRNALLDIGSATEGVAAGVAGYQMPMSSPPGRLAARNTIRPRVGVSGNLSSGGSTAATELIANSAPELSVALRGGSLLDPYAGVKDASAYLKSMGVNRAQRKQILESFEIPTLSVETAGENLYGLRFHDFGKTAKADGQYLFETFTSQTNRSGLALPPEWNGMTSMKQWQITPGTTVIRGRAGPQLEYGAEYSGGAEQMFVLQPWKYRSLK